MKTQTLILGVTLVLFANFAHAEENPLPSCGTNCTYTIENNVLTIKPIDKTKPATVKAYNRDCEPSCHTDAPWYGQGITEIDIKEGITNIGGHAFEDMTSVTTLKLPEGLQKIGGEAFNNAGGITKLELPSTLTSIGSYAFGGEPLEELNGIPDGTQSIGAYAFHGSKLSNVVIPASVTNLSPLAFGNDFQHYGRSLIESLYCSEAIADQCAAALQWKKDLGQKVEVITYRQTQNGQVFYNNKWYNSANDILSGDYVKKRIYSVDEASQVSGSQNTFKIRYK